MVEQVISTPRLVLRKLSVQDAPFILELLNDPGWLKFIGDKGVRTLDDAQAYIVNGPQTMYAQFGFGLYLTELKHGNASIGLCGLLKRDSLDAVDLGYALLPAYRGKGYACEAASAVLDYARAVLDIQRVLAITSVGNERSERLLGKLGFVFARQIRWASDESQARLFESEV
ncbi:MAG: GNAT family N-acetyltransferase [Xanthomonadales bacterium]|nr:GNAT family N-acetyltransferase [Xanthomonadales bacterium]